MTGDAELLTLATRVGEVLLARRLRLVTAESCTGGFIAKTLTDLPGSSQWFECGYVTYSNWSKTRDLGVATRILAEHGAVSESVAREMASDLAVRVLGLGAGALLGLGPALSAARDGRWARAATEATVAKPKPKPKPSSSSSPRQPQPRARARS